ncbi:MAG: hypothetical protein HFF52_01230 [Lawsonibacter sp.]|nr:hypothetical protein [Lawsonibacter sp.]
MKRPAALTLALVITLSALAGCSGKVPGSSADPGSSSGSAPGSSSEGPGAVQPMDLTGVSDPYLSTAGMPGSTVVATVGGADITAAEVLYWLNSNAVAYLDQFQGYLTEIPWDTQLEEGTLGSQLRDGALEAAAFYRMINLTAGKEGLSPSTDIDASLEQEFADLTEQLGSEEAVTYVFWSNLLTRDQLSYLNRSSDLYLQLQELYYGENSGHYPTDAEVMAWLDENGYFRVKHILLMTVDQNTRTPLDDETIAEKKASAADLLSQLQAAEDPIALFDQLMQEHSEDGGLIANPNGYIFNETDSLVGGFREAALALDVGEISDVVETDYGFHIMLRLPIDPKDYRVKVVQSRMQERADQWKTEYPVEKTAAFEQIDPASFWEQRTALKAAVDAVIKSSSSSSQG